MSLMAGAEAEGLLLGTKLTVGDMYDRKLIDDIAGGHLNCDWSKVEPRLRKMTRMLCGGIGSGSSASLKRCWLRLRSAASSSTGWSVEALMN
jgi:hypothetical protein